MTDKENLVMLNKLESQVAKILWPGINTNSPFTHEGRAYVRKAIEKIKEIFNISEEPASEDLEEAANDYAHDIVHDVFDSFKAGANWQKEQMKKSSFDAVVCKGGNTYLKEMDKDAIAKALAEYNDLDRVKVIIIKEAEK